MPNVGSRRIELLGTWNADGTVTGVTLTQSSQPIFCDGRGYLAFYFRNVGTTSGGTILVEEADWGPYEGPYSGTWSTVYTQSASTISGESSYRPPVGAYGYVRVRISSAITGGGTVLVSMRDLGVS